MVKPARLGSSVGMTLVHDPAELAAAPRTSPSATTRWSSPRLPRRRPRLEVSVIGNDPAALELYGPGEIVSGHEFYDYAAKYTAGLSETSTPRRGQPTPAGDHPQDRARRLPGHRRRGLRAGRLPARRRDDLPVRDQHDPRLHADQPLPDAAGRGRLHFADVCARIVELALERHAARGRRRISTRRTCPGEQRPARRAGRPRPPVPGASRHATGPARLGRPVARSAPAPRCVAARLGRARSTASPRRRPSTTRSCGSEGARYTDVAAVEAALADVRGDEPVPPRRPARSRPQLDALPTVARARVRSSCRTPSRSRSRSASRSWSGRSASGATSSMSRARSSPSSPTSRRPRRRPCR